MRMKESGCSKNCNRCLYYKNHERCPGMSGPVDGAAIFEDVAESHIAVAAQHIQAKSVLDTHFGLSLYLLQTCHFPRPVYTVRTCPTVDTLKLLQKLSWRKHRMLQEPLFNNCSFLWTTKILDSACQHICMTITLRMFSPMQTSSLPQSHR